LRLKLASWNLHRCVGSDGVMSAQRCAAVLREIDADMVALQEVESRPGHALDVLAGLARETRCEAVAGMTLSREDTHYGNALLTRLAASAVRRHDLSVPGREPRAALDVDFDLQGVSAQLIVTHLGLRPAERRQQVERLTDSFRKHQRDLVMLAGDLNEWFLWGRPLRRLHRIFPQTPHRRTWPARAPVFALDRIWVHPFTAMCRLYVYRSAAARIASDHLPLVAEIEWQAKRNHR
jgi:endonuclease/exonuclease/phosphatase family metal-dependent hydrolase